MTNHDNDIEHDFTVAKRGAVIVSGGKTRVTMYLDNDILQHFRQLARRNGRGYQTEINQCLRREIHNRGTTPHTSTVAVRLDALLPVENTGAAIERVLGATGNRHMHSLLAA